MGLDQQEPLQQHDHGVAQIGFVASGQPGPSERRDQRRHHAPETLAAIGEAEGGKDDLQATGRHQGDERQVQAAHAQGGQGHDPAEHHGHGRGHRQVELERQVEAMVHAQHHPAAHAHEPHLGERHHAQARIHEPDPGRGQGEAGGGGEDLHPLPAEEHGDDHQRHQPAQQGQQAFRRRAAPRRNTPPRGAVTHTQWGNVGAIHHSSLSKRMRRPRCSRSSMTMATMNGATVRTDLRAGDSVSKDSSTPMDRPPTSTMPRLSSRPQMAAAMDGMTMKVMMLGSSRMRSPNISPVKPAMSPAMPQAMVSTLRMRTPISADSSRSLASARICRPVRVRSR